MVTRQEQLRAAEAEVIEAAMRQLDLTEGVAETDRYERGWAAATREVEAACVKLRALREPRDPIREVRKWLDGIGCATFLAPTEKQRLMDILDACEHDRKAPAR